jgi:uncharacterized protein (TIGR02678 family)
VTGVRGTASAVTDALDAAREAERRRAVRALLRTPMLASTAPEFPLVRRHAGWLREWFGRETGWHLQVDTGHARLRKLPADHTDATRGPQVGGVPLRRRRYVLLCLCLAGLERSEKQTTLGRLAESVVAAAADPALGDLAFSLEQRDDRSDLVAAVRLLLELGVLRRVAGDEGSYVSGAGDALYDVDRRVLASLLVTRRGPSLVDAATTDERIAGVTAELVPDTDEARNSALRHALTRRLLDDPVMHYADLSEAELGYLTGQRAALLRRIREATGLEPEVRAEGIAMVDVAGSDALTDVRTPEEGTDGHATLLVAEHLAGNGRTSLSDLETFVAALAAEHYAHWRKGSAEPAGVAQLTALAVARLTALRLARLVDDAVEPLPALARFRLAQPIEPAVAQEALT